MKTIKMNDEDYNDLMELAKELRTQDHDSQANPRMWTVDTTQERVTKEGFNDTKILVINSNNDDSIDLEELNKQLLECYMRDKDFSNLDEIYESFIIDAELFRYWCIENDLCFDDNDDNDAVINVLQQTSLYSLQDYLEANDVNIAPIEEYEQHELNATFFKSDAKKHIEINKHNLAKNPHTYAFSIFRMPKMERLCDILNNLGEEK